MFPRIVAVKAPPVDGGHNHDEGPQIKRSWFLLDPLIIENNGKGQPFVSSVTVHGKQGTDPVSIPTYNPSRTGTIKMIIVLHKGMKQLLLPVRDTGEPDLEGYLFLYQHQKVKVGTKAGVATVIVESRGVPEEADKWQAINVLPEGAALRVVNKEGEEQRCEPCKRSLYSPYQYDAKAKVLFIEDRKTQTDSNTAKT